MSKRIIDDLQIIYDGLKNQSGGGITSIVVDGKTYTQNHGVITLPNHPKVDFNSEGNLVITINGVTKVFTPVSESVTEPEVFYSITNVLTQCKNSNTNATLKEGSRYTATITPNSGYIIKSISVTMGGTNITSSAVSNNTITIQEVTGNVVITAIAEVITYTITNTLTQCSTNNSNNSITKDSRYTATLTANSGYRIKTITVTMGGTNITSSAVSNDTITIAKVTGNVVITAVAEIISYPITNTLTKCSTNNNAVKANHNSAYEAIITADDEYKMDSLTITMGGTNITSSVVTPIVEAVPTYPVTNTLTHCTTNNTAATVEKDSVYEATITADAEYKMDSIAVTMGGTNINSSYITPITEKVPDAPVEPDNPGTEQPEDPSNPTIDGLSKMTYGRGINQTSGEMTTNAECWATVNPVSITSGKTYTITLDATYLWVVNCDNSGNVVTPFLTTGTNSKPQTFTFTASSSKIKFGCYDPSKQLTYCTITEGGTPSQPITPGQPSLPSEPDTASDTFSILAVNPVSINENYATGELTPDRGTGITNLTVTRGQAFNITYCTNSPATKHEISRDNGSTYTDITGSVSKTGTSAYRYQHSAVSNVNSYNMAIRVTNAGGNTSVRRFVVTFS